MIFAVIYVLLFIACFFAVGFIRSRMAATSDFTSLKTVTFGDESAVRADRIGSVLSVVVIFFLWAAFTGSSYSPVTVPPPFTGETRFTYTVQGPDGATDTAEVVVNVQATETNPPAPEIEPGDGAAKSDSAGAKAWSSALILFDKNDEWARRDGAKLLTIDGQPVDIGQTVPVSDGVVTITEKGAINFKPDPGWQMQPLYLPSPEQTADRFAKLWTEGYKNNTLAEHLFWSLSRVTLGFLFGALIGIPLGYAMGLSGWARGWFDPIVEFMRPIPPLALIPLVIIWFGIGELGKNV
ncbi:MAG: ABC transporter permease, partial [Pseudomonadota bacterium]